MNLRPITRPARHNTSFVSCILAIGMYLAVPCILDLQPVTRPITRPARRNTIYMHEFYRLGHNPCWLSGETKDLSDYVAGVVYLVVFAEIYIEKRVYQFCIQIRGWREVRRRLLMLSRCQLTESARYIRNPKRSGVGFPDKFLL